jgi:hypothetical protein
MTAIILGTISGTILQGSLAKRGMPFVSNRFAGAACGALSGWAGSRLLYPVATSSTRIVRLATLVFGHIIPLAVTLGMYYSSWKVFKTCCLVGGTVTLSFCLACIAFTTAGAVLGEFDGHPNSRR